MVLLRHHWGGDSSRTHWGGDLSVPTEDWQHERGERTHVVPRVIPCFDCENPLRTQFIACPDTDHFHVRLVCICGADWGSPIPYYLIDGEYHVHR